MTTIWGDPDEKFAVDWDWRRGLTVWTLTGRRSEPKYAEKVLEHELPARPGGEQEAAAAARRWWTEQGRAKTLAATGGEPAAGEPAADEATPADGGSARP